MILGPKTTSLVSKPKNLRKIKTTIKNIVPIDLAVPPNDGSIYLADVDGNYFADNSGAFIAVDPSVP